MFGLDIEEGETSPDTPTQLGLSRAQSAAQAALSQATAAATKPRTFVPKRPTMGHRELVGVDACAAWTGGAPKPRWPGLIDPNPQNKSLTMCRSARTDLDQKARSCRVKGSDPEMSRTGDMEAFEKNAEKHLENCGLDTISCLPSPSNDAKMILVVKNHAQFEIKAATANSEDEATSILAITRTTPKPRTS